MGYRLRDNLGFCIVGGTPVFLDLAENRYFCLPPQLQEAFLALSSNQAGEDISSGALDALIAHRLITRHGGASQLMPCRGSMDLVDRSSIASAQIPWGERICAGAEIALMVGRLRFRPLRGITDQFRRLKCANRSDVHADDRPCAIGAIYQRAGWMISTHDLCLPRSLALAFRLVRIGICVELVFGVAMRPFAAHCWVQHRGRLLNDRIERVRDFTPILIL